MKGLFASCMTGRHNPVEQRPATPTVLERIDAYILNLKERRDRISIQLKYCEDQAKQALDSAANFVYSGSEDDALQRLYVQNQFLKQRARFDNVHNMITRAINTAVQYRQNEITLQAFYQMQNRIRLMDLDELEAQALEATEKLENAESMFETLSRYYMDPDIEYQLEYLKIEAQYAENKRMDDLEQKTRVQKPVVVVY